MKMNVAYLCLFSALISFATASGTLLFENTITQQHFSRLLRTAFDDEVTFKHLGNKNNRQLGQLLPNESEQLWLDVIQFGWQWVHSPHHRALRTDPNHPEPIHPLVLCNHAPEKSGAERLQLLAEPLGIPIEMSQTVSNTEEESCFIVSAPPSIIQAVNETEMRDSSFAPLTDVTKIASGGVSYILEDTEWQPTSTGTDEEGEQNHVTSLMIDLIPGEGNDEDFSTVADKILNDVIVMAQASVNDTSIVPSSYLRSSVSNQPSDIVPLRHAFSLTSSLYGTIQPRMSTSEANLWSEALSSGFEAPHGCQDMLDMIQVREREGVEGFELILKADKMENIEGTAWNKDCVISLMMGLSVQSSVQSIEVGRPLIAASFEDSSSARNLAIQGITNPQWITQSGIVGKRPFFDNNLDGSGQTIGVADSGLDTNNCYFYDSTNSDEDIYGRYSWDFSQRKVVHYDSDFADGVETNGGHGSAVAAAAMGRRSFDGINESNGYADGTAPGAKLAFLDMGIGSAAIQDPGVKRLFELSKSNSGAKVINGSWGRTYYGVYASFCRDYDSVIRNTYTDVLFVTSSGNTGKTKGVITVQNPADCKNSLAVGSGLNYGNDLRPNELGIEYLADYSSKGPTADGRIKPDIVGPGHFILSANPNVDMVGECDGDVPKAYYGGRGDGVRYVTGTSFAAPAVAGTALILRQYFMEGYCGVDRCCGKKSCGSKIIPSNSLMKALLLNGAVPMTGKVQVVPSGDVSNESFGEYDGKQGFGRVNLIRTVPLYGSNLLQLITVNNKTIADGDSHEFTVDIDTSNGCSSELSVTLVWMDPPGATGCVSCLVNDLDVLVEEIGGNSQTYYPNGLTSRDTKNTAERIRVNTLDGDRYKVVVKATNLVSTQEYSLAIAGCLAAES